jgi:hypothetical protein
VEVLRQFRYGHRRSNAGEVRKQAPGRFFFHRHECLPFVFDVDLLKMLFIVACVSWLPAGRR